MRRLLKIAMLIPVLYLVAMPFYFRHTTGLRACGGLNIIVADSADYRFVSSSEIRKRVVDGPHKYAGVPMRDISLEEIEKRVSLISELRTTEAYLTSDGTMHIRVDQRNPVIRVASSSGVEYYIDEEGFIMRKRGLYPPRVHIASGRIDIKESTVINRRIGDTDVPRVMKDLYDLVSYLRQSHFWSAIIDQVEVGANGDLVLIPRTAGHRIVLGDLADLDIRFSALEAFYKNVLPESGWDKYREINLKYSGQIICKKR
jgi:cell division protein FtsQ